MSRLVYIASPYAGDVEGNIEFAKAACRYAMECGQTPVAVHLLYPQFLRDSDPAEREAGLRMGREVLAVCGELWCCGSHISEGMAMEIAEAERLGIPIREVSAQEIRGGIHTEKQDLITEKLYSPLSFQLRDNAMTDEEWRKTDWRMEAKPHETMQDYMNHIDGMLRHYREELSKGDYDFESRGLMTYYDENELLFNKIYAIYPNIELHDNRLWCVAEIKLIAPLTAEETKAFKEHWAWQLSDGWGNSISQRHVQVPCGELYLSPSQWDDEFFIATEQEFLQRLAPTAERLALRDESEKPSVLSQLREAKPVPAAAQPQQSHKKTGLEH